MVSRLKNSSTLLRSKYVKHLFVLLLTGILPSVITLSQAHSALPSEIVPVRVSIYGLPSATGVKALVLTEDTSLPAEITSIQIETVNPGLLTETVDTILVESNQTKLDIVIGVDVGNDYTITVTAFDAAGIARFQGKQIGVTVGADFAPPPVKILLRRFDATVFSATTSPASGSTGVPTSTSITATFSKPIAMSTIIAPATNFVVTETISGNAVTGSIFFDATARTAIFTPTTLAPATSYTIRLTTGILEPNGNTVFTTDLTSTFVTVFTTGPPSTTVPVGAVGANVFIEDFEPLAGTKSVDGFDIEPFAINVSPDATVDPFTILDTEGNEAIGVPELLGLDADGVPVLTSTTIAGIVGGIGVSGSQAFSITADFDTSSLANPMFFLGGKGSTAGTQALGGGFGTARQTHGATLPLAGGIISFFAQQTAGSGDEVIVLVNDKDGESFTTAVPQTLPTGGFKEFAFRILLTSEGGDFVQDFSNLPINSQPGGVPNGAIDEIVSIQFVMLNKGDKNPSATMLVDDVMASGPDVSVDNSVMTLLNNSIEILVDDVVTESVNVTSITSGLATIATPTSTPADKTKLKFTLEPVSGLGDLTTQVDFSLSSQTDSRQLSLKLSPVLIGNTRSSAVVTIPSNASITFLGQDAAGNGISLTLVNIGTIVTASGPTLTVDPNALAGAVAGVLPGSNVETTGTFKFTAEIGGQFVLASSGSTTCPDVSSCTPVTKVSGILTTTD